ncbi:MAG: glycosyltransferase family protein [Patescibacteria group bacterium]
MQNNIVAIIQARMGSARLPGKVLLNIAEKPMLRRVIERVKKASLVNKVIVATSDKKRDDLIKKLCQELKIECFRGSEEDVLNRYYEAAKGQGAKIIVRITSDCPLVDHLIIDKIIKIHLKNRNDYTANNTENSYPKGLDVEVFNFKSLERANYEAKKNYQREHVTPYFYEHPDIFKIEILVAEDILNRPKLRFCVDTKEDLIVVRKIYTALLKSKKPINFYNVIKLLDNHQEITKVNANVRQKRLGE